MTLATKAPYDRRTIRQLTHLLQVSRLEGLPKRMTHLTRVHQPNDWREQAARLAADGRPFLTGATFSKADIIWSLKVLRSLECGYPFARNFPALQAWYRRVEQRSGFRDGGMRAHRPMSLASRAKAAVENWLGIGLRQVSTQASL